MKRSARLAIGYAGNLGVLAVLTLLFIPALVGSVGGPAWGDVAVGQTIGVVASTLIMYGWGIAGPAEIARGGQYERRREFLESMLVRASMAPVTIVPAAYLGTLVANNDALVVAGVASTAVLGLRPGWMFIGLGSPRLLFLYETLPRAVATAVAILALEAQWMDAVAALYVQTSGCILAFVAAWIWSTAHASSSDHQPHLDSLRTLLSRHRNGVVASFISSLYSASPTILVAILAPSALPVFALVNRLASQVSTAASPLIDAMQSWVPQMSISATHERARRLVKLTTALGAVGSVIYVVVAPFLLDLLGRGSIDATLLLVALSAMVVALGFVAQTTVRAGLGAMGGMRIIRRTTIIGSCAGLAAMLVLIPLYGATGAFAGVGTGLLVTVLFNVAAIYRGSPGGEESQRC